MRAACISRQGPFRQNCCGAAASFTSSWPPLAARHLRPQRPAGGAVVPQAHSDSAASSALDAALLLPTIGVSVLATKLSCASLVPCAAALPGATSGLAALVQR